jgi:hypothetical protein
MFRRICILITVLVLPVSCCASSVAYSKVKVGRTVARVVTADLNNPEVKVTVALARGGAGRQETFKSIVRRTKPTAAVTGTFFDTRTLMPTGDIAVFGTVIHSGVIGSALCIGPDNKASIISLKAGRDRAWKNYETVLCAGPRLIDHGRIAIALGPEGFRASLSTPARRTGVGITRAGKLLLVAIDRRTSLHDMARVLMRAGACDALCLDGGSSAALYHSGAFRVAPLRALTNCLLVYSRHDAYRAAKNELAPAGCFAKAADRPADGYPRTEPRLRLLTFSALIRPAFELPAAIGPRR